MEEKATHLNNKPKEEGQQSMGIEKVHTDMTAVELNEKAWAAFGDMRPHTHVLSKPDLNPQAVFGYMVELAMPILEAYHSDLYHDVENLQERNWENAQIFYYCFGKCGTNILDKLSTARMVQKHGREYLYKFTYTYHPRFKDVFQLTIERVLDDE